MLPYIKPLHTKVHLNASILYKKQEICNKTNLWKFQLISLLLLRETSKNAFSIFVFILMAGVCASYRKSESVKKKNVNVLKKVQYWYFLLDISGRKVPSDQ